MWDRIFQLRQRGTTVNREIAAGMTTFMAMAYIIFVNPAILSNAGVPFNGAVTATCVVSGLITILMGLVTNYPLALACGMGLNAMVAFDIVAGLGQTWQTAMGVVALEGLAVLILSLSPLRAAVMRAIPEDLKLAIGVGLGLFIALIGLEQARIVCASPVTLVTLGSFHDPVTRLSLAGLAIILVLLSLNVQGALLIGMILTAMIGCCPWVRLIPNAPEHLWLVILLGLAVGLILVFFRVPGAPLWAAAVALGAACLPPFSLFSQLAQNPLARSARSENFSTFFRADLLGALSLKLLPVGFAFFMTDFFDTMGTALGIGRQAGFVDEKGQIPRIRGLLVVDSLGAFLGGISGCSSVTSYVESAAGVSAGGRTGLVCLTAGLAFWLSLFFIPLIRILGGGVEIAPGAFAYPVTAPALITVGFMMCGHVGRIQFNQIETGLPAFLILSMIPLTYSITNGIAFGFISHCLIQLVRGRIRQVHPMLYIVALLFLISLALR